MLMAEVYSKAEWPVDEGNKSTLHLSERVRRGVDGMVADSEDLERLVEILRAFPPEEPTKKRFVQEIIGWSGRLGELERGDPELHHVAGSLYAQGMCLATSSTASANNNTSFQKTSRTTQNDI